MLELTLIHVSKKGLDCIKIGKVWSIRVICIRRFGNLSSRLHVSNSGTRTLFDWKCGVSVFHSCNIRIVWGLWSQSNFHDMIISIINTVETLYSTIYYSKYFIELNFEKSTQYVALWTHKRHPIPRPFGRAMECLLWVLQQKLTVL